MSQTTHSCTDHDPPTPTCQPRRSTCGSNYKPCCGTDVCVPDLSQVPGPVFHVSTIFTCASVRPVLTTTTSSFSNPPQSEFAVITIESLTGPPVRPYCSDTAYTTYCSIVSVTYTGGGYFADNQKGPDIPYVTTVPFFRSQQCCDGYACVYTASITRAYSSSIVPLITGFGLYVSDPTYVLSQGTCLGAPPATTTIPPQTDIHCQGLLTLFCADAVVDGEYVR